MVDLKYLSRIYEIETILAERAVDMQKTFKELEKDRILDSLPFNTVLSQKEKIDKNYREISDMMANYTDLTGSKVNPDYAVYLACANAVIRIFKTKIRKLEGESLSRLSDADSIKTNVDGNNPNNWRIEDIVGEHF